MKEVLVAPLVGAWIEIIESKHKCVSVLVAPLVGAWIEIAQDHGGLSHLRSRSPRGSVD